MLNYHIIFMSTEKSIISIICPKRSYYRWVNEWTRWRHQNAVTRTQEAPKIFCTRSPRLLRPPPSGTTRLIAQWMLHWWWVNGSTASELFLAPTHQRRARDWTDRNFYCLGLQCDVTWNQTESTGLGFAWSTNCTTSPVT